MSSDDHISRIEAALEAGPTVGPWTVLPAIAGEQCVARINALEVVPPTGIELARDFIDAEYIAACNPFVIRTLLARLKAAEKNVRGGATRRPSISSASGICVATRSSDCVPHLTHLALPSRTQDTHGRQRCGPHTRRGRNDRQTVYLSPG